MAEHYRFFDSTGEDERVYTADEFAEYFRRVLSDGIFNGGTNLKVETSGSDIRTYIRPGYAWIQGYLYKIDTEPLYMQHEYPDPNLDRMDRIVIRLDKRLEHRYVRAFILTGVPAAKPIEPALTRDENIFELSLAKVLIKAGKSYIEGWQVTDERLNTSVCGLVNSLIQADTTEIFNQFQFWYDSKTAEFQQEWQDFIKDLPALVPADRVTIKDSGNHFTSTTVEGALAELFTFASDGKTKIAAAVTGKGVQASPHDTFTQLAEKIGLIYTGKKWATGNKSFSVTASDLFFSLFTNPVTFTPKFAIASIYWPAATNKWQSTGVWIESGFFPNDSPLIATNDFLSGFQFKGVVLNTNQNEFKWYNGNRLAGSGTMYWALYE